MYLCRHEHAAAVRGVTHKSREGGCGGGRSASPAGRAKRAPSHVDDFATYVSYIHTNNRHTYLSFSRDVCFPTHTYMTSYTCLIPMRHTHADIHTCHFLAMYVSPHIHTLRHTHVYYPRVIHTSAFLGVSVSSRTCSSGEGCHS